ncbi:MAG TPA: threonine/serine dehydratase [Bacteroidota bacterium]|nr:threonine/serine dehydratase [Bacteroidota bacterium]
MNHLPTFDDIVDARRVIGQHLTRTPLYRYAGLSELLGCNAFVKHENHQPICVFKIRGGINLVSRLNDDERRRGVVTASTGNHGQSIAYASKMFGVTATIVVPEKSNPDKVSAIERMGATIVFHGKDFDEAREQAEQLAVSHGYRYIHSANEPLLIAGVGTIGAEIVEDCPEVDVIVVPVGGGSGASGTSIAVKAMKPTAEVIGVQSELAPAAYFSWKEGKPVSSDLMKTFAEGLATRVGFSMTVEIMKRNLSDFVLVSDDDIRRAMKLILEHTHNLVEGSGAAPLAGALKIKDRLKGKNVVMVLSGANVTITTLREVLSFS